MLIRDVMHYTNVFTFVDRLSDLVRLKSKRVVHASLYSCLKSDALLGNLRD